MISEANREYYYGVDRVVYNPRDISAEAWTGVVSVEELYSGGDSTVIFVDGEGKRSSYLSSDFEATIKAYQHPETIEDVIFDLSYRVMVGPSNDYEIHILYNCIGSITSELYSTINNDSEDPVEYTIDISTTPSKSPVPTFSPGAHVKVRKSSIQPDHLEALEDLLYGTDDTDPTIPPLADLEDFMESWAHLRIIDHGNGTWTASGPDEAVYMVGDDEFAIDWPSVKILDPNTYEVRSL